MSVLVDSQCLLCHFQKNLKAAQALGTGEQAMEFARGLMKIYLDSPKNVGATWYGPATADLFHEIYGIGHDRFRQEKLDSNAFVLNRMEQIRGKVASASDPVLAGLQFAILGNYIDFSALHGEIGRAHV